MKLAVGSDERTQLTDAVVADLRERGHTLTLFGPLNPNNKDYWPRVAQDVAEAVQSGAVDEGVLFCWTGTGVALAANKVRGIRAALCDDAETARGARLWNNANIICFSIRRLSEVMAKEILDAWFTHRYEPNDVDDACIAQVEAIEEKWFASR